MKPPLPSHHRHSIRLKGYDYAQAGAYFVTLVTWRRESIFGKIANGQIALSPYGQVAWIEWQKLPARFSHLALDNWTLMPNHLHAILFIDPALGARQNQIPQSINGAVASTSPSIDQNGARLQNSDSIGEFPLASPLPSIDQNGAEPNQNPQSINGAVWARLQNSDSIGDFPLASPLRDSHPGLASGSLGAVVGAYKTVVTRILNNLRRTPGQPIWQRNYYEHIIRDENELDRIRAYITANPARWSEDSENPAGRRR